MPDIFSPLEAIKQALLADATQGISEADAREQMFAQQIAQRRRIARLKPGFETHAQGDLAMTDMAEMLATGNKLSPADYAGLHPHEMVDMVARGRAEAENARIATNSMFNDMDTEEVLRQYRQKEAAAAGMPNATTLSDADYAAGGMTSARNPRLHDLPVPVAPGGPVEQRFGPLEDMRAKMGPDFYGSLARSGDDPYAFARDLAGQLSLQRQRAVGPDHEWDQDAFVNPPVVY